MAKKRDHIFLTTNEKGEQLNDKLKNILEFLTSVRSTLQLDSKIRISQINDIEKAIKTCEELIKENSNKSEKKDDEIDIQSRLSMLIFIINLGKLISDFFGEKT